MTYLFHRWKQKCSKSQTIWSPFPFPWVWPTILVRRACTDIRNTTDATCDSLTLLLNLRSPNFYWVLIHVAQFLILSSNGTVGLHSVHLSVYYLLVRQIIFHTVLVWCLVYSFAMTSSESSDNFVPILWFCEEYWFLHSDHSRNHFPTTVGH